MSTKRKLAPLPANYDPSGLHAAMPRLQERQRKIDAYPVLIQQRDELLACLQKILREDDGDRPEFWPFEEVFDEARAIVAKVKGQT